MRLQTNYLELTNEQLFDEFRHRFWTASDILNDFDKSVVVRILLNEELYWFSNFFDGRNIVFVSNQEEDIYAQKAPFCVMYTQPVLYREILLQLLHANFGVYIQGEVKIWKNQYVFLRYAECSCCHSNSVVQREMLDHTSGQYFT